MPSIPYISILLLSAYLIGAIPVGLLISKLKGVDIRSQGSGNYGATNVGRILGRKWGILVLLLDAIKGFICCYLALRWLRSSFGQVISDSDLRTLFILWIAAGMCCVIGNVAPVYLRFKGGKGVATSLGVILGIYPYLTYPGVIALIIWVLALKLFRYVSLGSILAAASMPLGYGLVAWWQQWPLAVHWPFPALCSILALLVIYRHRSNIQRLLAGTENRVGTGDNPG